MYDETNVPGPEYKVRPVVRYLVTVFFHPYQTKDGTCGAAGSSQVVGEFDAEGRAIDVAEALQKLSDQQIAAMRAGNEQPEMVPDDADDMA